ncbi:MAG: hypothetical protein OCC49_18175 [Fibrobacterales bacterium]
MFESGATTSRSWQIPSSLLEQGGSYYWKVIDQSQGTSNDWASFTVDTRRRNVQAVDAFGPMSVGLASGELTTAAGTIGVPTVAGQLRLSLSYSSAKHTTTNISEGWSLAGLSDLGYVQATYSDNLDAITLSTLSGGALTFVQSETDALWQATGQDDLSAGLAGSLTVNDDGEIIYTTMSGDVSVFNSYGNLQSKSVAGQGSETQWELSWSANRIIGITDPVSNRRALFYYMYPGNYSRTGFDSYPPSGKLSRFINLDGRTTTLFYKDAQLARVEQTGGKVVDFAYDLAGRLAELRTAEAADADASDGVDSDRRYAISYLSDGRVEAIESPAPSSGASRFSHTYDYNDSATTVTRQINGQDTPLKTVTYDSRWRTVSDADLVTGMVTSYEWDGDEDRLSSVVDGRGLKRTAHFDAYGRIETVYGPANEMRFNTDGTPIDDIVPFVTTVYDEKIDPLVVRAWNQSGFVGAPAAIGVSKTSFDMTDLDGFSATDGWSAVFSTVLTVPSDGKLHIRALMSGNTAASVTLIASGAVRNNSRKVNIIDATAGEVIPVTVLIDCSTENTSGTLNLATFSRAGTATWEPLSDIDLSPGLGLKTQTSGNEQLNEMEQTTTLSTSVAYHDPILGTPKSQTADPMELELTTALEYGDSYGRLAGQTLPSGMASSFSYWDGGTAECDGAYTQSGSLAGVTIAHPTQANTAGRTVTILYNESGQKVGTKVDDEAASCMTYDDRGRVVTIDVPATDDASAKQLTYEYGLTGSQSRVTQRSTVGSDNSTAARTTKDMLGRVVETIDEWGTVVITEYDDRIQSTTRTTTITDTNGNNYSSRLVSYHDAAGRITSLTRNDVLLASADYNDANASVNINYGNGVKQEALQGPYGRTERQTLTLANDEQVEDMLMLAPSGRIMGEILKSPDGTMANYTYTYDNALRLINANLSGDHPDLNGGEYTWAYDFDYDNVNSLNPQAGKDGAVTKETVTSPSGVEVKEFAYNYVDGLTAINSDTDINDVAVTYDASGYNMATLTKGDGTTLSLSYDQENQLVATSDNAGKSVDYIRSADNRLIAKEIQQDGVTEFYNLYSSNGWVLNNLRVPQSQTVALPGGVMVSFSADATTQRWQHSSLQGHALLTTDEVGAQQADLVLYSPYGEALTAAPEVVSSAPVYGYDGASGVETESLAIDIVLMGARVYVPMLHSFTTTDPTFNGGSSPYDYANSDPINLNDPSGNSPNNNIFSKGFWDVENPYMWAFIGGVAIGLATGGAIGFMAPSLFAIGLGTAVAAGAVSGGVGLFVYGMATNGDAIQSLEMAGMGAAYGAAGGAIGYMIGYGIGYGVQAASASPTTSVSQTPIHGSVETLNGSNFASVPQCTVAPEAPMYMPPVYAF